MELSRRNDREKMRNADIYAIIADFWALLALLATLLPTASLQHPMEPLFVEHILLGRCMSVRTQCRNLQHSQK